MSKTFDKTYLKCPSEKKGHHYALRYMRLALFALLSYYVNGYVAHPIGILLIS